MKNRDYYNYYEILFSLRKEYLKNQKIINELLSYVRITNDPYNIYDSNVVFKTNSKDNIDSLLLIVKKRQSSIRLILDSLYSSLVYNDTNYTKSGYFSYSFRLSKDHVYLLDDNQDGRYLSAKVEIDNQKEFIELYKELLENVICKHGRTNLFLEKENIQFSNNGIHLFYVEEDDYKNHVRMDYDGIGDNIIINNASYLDNIMRLEINKNSIPNYFEIIIDSNMDNYLYTIEGDSNKNEELYTIEIMVKN